MFCSLHYFKNIFGNFSHSKKNRLRVAKKNHEKKSFKTQYDTQIGIGGMPAEQGLGKGWASGSLFIWGADTGVQVQKPKKA